MNKLMEHFGHSLVTILSKVDGSIGVSQGMLTDADDNFIYLSRDNSGMVDCVLLVSNIISIQLFEDTPELVDPENETKSKIHADKLDEVLQNLGIDDSDNDDEGNLQ